MALSRFTALVPAALLLCAAAQAAPDSNARSRYSEERAACASVPAESRAACVREAGAAQQAARAGQLTSESGAYERNAMARCEVFKTPGDRSDCEARIRSGSTVSGSVEGGGVLREAETLVTPR
jgi:hypothetical protein